MNHFNESIVPKNVTKKVQILKLPIQFLLQMADYLALQSEGQGDADEFQRQSPEGRRTLNIALGRKKSFQGFHHSSSSKTMSQDSTGRWCFLKLLQVILIGLLMYAFSSFFIFRQTVKSSKSTHEVLDGLRSNARKPLLFNEKDNEVFLKTRKGNSNPGWAKVVHAPESFCEGVPNYPKIVIVVHSRPNNQLQRTLIRQTWGSVKSLEDGSSVKLLFVLGNQRFYSDKSEFKLNYEKNYDLRNVGKGTPVSNLVEAIRFNDILIGDFHDTYHNLTIKHELGIRWAAENCAETSLLLKADDDAFIDLHGLTRFLNRTLGTMDPQNTIACDVIPEGTAPRRSGKWKVSYLEYPSEKYPRYCSGLAYVLSMDAAKKLLSKVETSIWLWVDDVWMTGILAEDLKLSYILLNARYCYDEIVIKDWMVEAPESVPPPCMVLHLDTSNSQYPTILRTLWKHSSYFR